jgi:tryptophan-specific transport protein
MQDRLSLNNSSSHRFIAAACCFVPPAVASFFLPYGFVHAISYAGLFVAFSFFILPGVMAIKMSKKTHLVNNRYTPYVVIVFGIIIIILKVALTFSLLPVFGES